MFKKTYGFLIAYIKRMNKTTLIISALIFIVLAAIVAGSTLFPSKDAVTPPEKEQGVVTTLFSVKRQTLVEDLTFLGTLESETTAAVSSKMTGEVLKIHMNNGEAVNKNDLIITLDQTQLTAKKDTMLKKKATLVSQLSYLTEKVSGFHASNPIIDRIANVQETLEFQENNLEKLKLLFDIGAISQLELDQSQHQVNTLLHQSNELKASANETYEQLVQEKHMATHLLQELEASLAELEISISETKIRAPFDGEIRQILVEEGDLAAAGKPIANVDKGSPSKVIIRVSETDLNRLGKGIQAEVSFPNQEVVYYGMVSSISTGVNPQTRIGTVEVSLDSAAVNTVKGSSAQVRFILSQENDQILIPAEAVKEISDRHVAYIYDNNNLVHEESLILGPESGGFYKVIEGLEDGDIIAAENLDSLYDGAAVYPFHREVSP